MMSFQPYLPTWHQPTRVPGRTLRGFRLFASVVAILLALTFLISCATSPRQVERSLIRSDFEGARQILENMGAGAYPDDDLSPRKAAARESFESTVTAAFERKAEVHLMQGALPEAIGEINAGLHLCPWSARLSELQGSYSTRLRSVHETQDRWQIVEIDDHTEVDTARALMVDVSALGEDYRSSRRLTSQRTKSLKLIDSFWADAVSAHDAGGGSFSEIDYLASDLNAPEFEILRQDVAFNTFIAVTGVTDAEDQLNTLLVKASRAIGSPAPTYSATDLGQQISSAARDQLAKWFEAHHAALFRAEPSLASVNAAESVYTYLGIAAPEGFLGKLAQLHFEAASRLSGLNTAAILTFVHGERARHLHSERFSKRVEELYQRAMASLKTSNDLNASLIVDAESAVEPALYDLVRLAIFSDIAARTGPHFQWTLEPIGHAPDDRRIVVTSVRHFQPDLQTLNEVRSSYHSHNEQIPNPLKALYRSQLSSAEYSVNMARMNYQSAVRTHNIRPTQYTLMAANNAYNRYQYAVNDYNRLVRQYNMTSSTITRPVYLPYSFSQGNISFGWEISVRVHDTERVSRLHGRSLVSSFVRYGTRYNDRNAEYRRDTPLSFRTDYASNIDHLWQAIQQITQELHEFVGNSFELTYQAGLEKEEIELVRWLLHPWMRESKADGSVPGWVLSVLPGIDIPDLTPSPSPLLLEPPPASGYGQARSTEQIIENALRHVVLIRTRTGRSEGTSSGAIIGPNGLVLTSAHGLAGSELHVEIDRSGLLSSFPASIIYIDHGNDVALIRAQGLRSSDWLPVRLNQSVTAGESIFVLGNPSLPDGSFVRNAATSGTVAAPLHHAWGGPRLVADVTISSGSSGGPVVSALDGAVVGIVVAVASPEFKSADTGRSASGMFALAAPASHFADWLGLRQK